MQWTVSNLLKNKVAWGEDKSYLNKGINVQHQSLSPTDDKLIDTGNSMRPRNKIQNTLIEALFHLQKTGKNLNVPP